MIFRCDLIGTQFKEEYFVLRKLYGAILFLLGYIYIKVLPDFFPSMSDWWVINLLIGVGICIGGASFWSSSKRAEND